MNTGWSSLTYGNIIYCCNAKPGDWTAPWRGQTCQLLSVKYVETSRQALSNWGRAGLGSTRQQFISHKLLSDLSSENCGVLRENNAVMRAETFRAHDGSHWPCLALPGLVMIYDPVFRQECSNETFEPWERYYQRTRSDFIVFSLAVQRVTVDQT